MKQLLQRAVIICCLLTAPLANYTLANDCYRQTYYQPYVQVQQILVPVYAQAVYYSAGVDIQAEAFAEKVFRKTQEMQKQVQAPIKSQVQAPRQQQVQAPLQSPVQAPQKQLTPSQNPTYYPAGDGGGLQVTQGILARKCSECHSGDRPKKGITIDGITGMFPDQVVSAIEQLMDDSMPRGGPPLTGAEKQQALKELVSLRISQNVQPAPEPELRPSQDPQPPVREPQPQPRRESGNDLPQPSEQPVRPAGPGDLQ